MVLVLQMYSWFFFFIWFMYYNILLKAPYCRFHYFLRSNSHVSPELTPPRAIQRFTGTDPLEGNPP